MAKEKEIMVETMWADREAEDRKASAQRHSEKRRAERRLARALKDTVILTITFVAILIIGLAIAYLYSAGLNVIATVIALAVLWLAWFLIANKELMA